MSGIISLGINDYRISSGGTNKVILSHQKLFNKKEFDYIFICPVTDTNKKISLWKIILNNKFIAVKSTDNLIVFLLEYQRQGGILNEFHIHHLKKAKIIDVEYLLEQIKIPIKFYIHDYYTICPVIPLMKNGNMFCGCERVTVEKCSNCKYYMNIREREQQIRKLLERYKERILFIAPSEVAKKQWLTAYAGFDNSIKVVSHQSFCGNYHDGNQTIVNEDRIRCAFIGEQLFCKGWESWKMLLCNVNRDEYEFYYFGNPKEKIAGVKNIKVDFTKNLDAMIMALREYKINCVILWSLLPETYSYTYYESFAANTFVITNKLSGNIARQVEKNGNGLVLNDDMELCELFHNTKRLKKYINTYKMDGVKGPEGLQENEEILELVNLDIVVEELTLKRERITIEEFVITQYFRLRQFFMI